MGGLAPEWGGYPLLPHRHGNGQCREAQLAPQRNLENSNNVNFLLSTAPKGLRPNLELQIQYEARS